MPPAFPSNTTLPEVESLRGVAIALVVAYHADGWVHFRPVAAPVEGGWLAAFVHAGHSGVSLFFVLSAFLLARPFLAEAAGALPVDRRRYFRRRALRILPLYWSAVLVTALLCAREWSDVAATFYYLLFLNGIDGHLRPFLPYASVWWSLATEVQFYLLLPLLPYVLRRGRARVIAVLLLLAYLLAYTTFCAGWWRPMHPAALNVLVHSVAGRAPLFASGILAAWVWLHYGQRLRAWAAAQPVLRHGGGDLLVVLLLGALATLLRAVAARGYVPAEIDWPQWHIAEGLLWSLLLLAVLLLPLRTKRLLCNPLLGGIGRVSYSVYLIHTAVFWHGLVGLGFTYGWTSRSLAWCATLCTATLLASAITYRCIELPWLRLKR